MPERDSHCWKTLRIVTVKKKDRKRIAGVAKIAHDRYWSLTVDVIRCHRHEHLEAQRRRVLRERERETEEGEEHDTNRFVSELRPTWCDLGLWGLLLGRASILISVDIYYAPITVNTESFRVIRNDRCKERERTFTRMHVALASLSSKATRPVHNNNCVIFHTWINI